jgi:hypothetical protein
MPVEVSNAAQSQFIMFLPCSMVFLRTTGFATGPKPAKFDRPYSST